MPKLMYRFDILTLGKLRVAGKTPPSKGVSSGPWIKHSHSKRLDSSIGPATIPSGDSLSRALYSLRRRLLAAANDIVWACDNSGVTEGGNLDVSPVGNFGADKATLA